MSRSSSGVMREAPSPVRLRTTSLNSDASTGGTRGAPSPTCTKAAPTTHSPVPWTGPVFRGPWPPPRPSEQGAKVDLFLLFLLEQPVHGVQDPRLGRAADGLSRDSGVYRAVGDGPAAAGLPGLLGRLRVLRAPREPLLQLAGPVFREKGLEGTRGRDDAAAGELLGGGELGVLRAGDRPA